MPEPTAPVGQPTLTEDQQMFSIALSGILQQMLKRPQLDDEDQPSNSGVTTELNKMMAQTMAESIAAGFGT